LDYGGNIVDNGHSCRAQRFSIAFINSNWSLQNLDFMI
jgi:hypothetical protein